MPEFNPLSPTGQALSEAAWEAALAERALVRLVLRLEAAGMELDAEGIEVIDAVCALTTGMIDAAEAALQEQVAISLSGSAYSDF